MPLVNTTNNSRRGVSVFVHFNLCAYREFNTIRSFNLFSMIYQAKSGTPINPGIGFRDRDRVPGPGPGYGTKPEFPIPSGHRIGDLDISKICISAFRNSQLNRLSSCQDLRYTI